MPLPNATDLGTFTARSREQDRRLNESKRRRDRGFIIAVAAPTTAALLLAYVWTSQMVLPAWERTNHANQEQVASWGN
ncbi:hypothetical protein ABID21_001878 [Pseudorhizobium tarimense]|uniref:Uncharacterized protein n=1 Tax=Pseudorhizobium tarimense TaxID=1079109 RepID=A0ABV2H5H8_9HYPH|nr:hypothetical protein [Pseudorhizobium tarimense]MCJ8518974.1 hypothetical protein [Pseudorhizobium tarimense]